MYNTYDIISFKQTSKHLVPCECFTYCTRGLWSYGSWNYNYLYAISAYHHWSCEFESHSDEVYSIQHYVIVCQWLATGRWFSPGTPVSSTNKTDRCDKTEILLKVALNTIIQPNQQTRYCEKKVSPILSILNHLNFHHILSFCMRISTNSFSTVIKDRK